ncbi:MAG TPA: hypothetical protein VHW90_00405 [Stellaceae bacterium]|nr:hypothetical protein [Stellaceae bacterium]
MLLGFRALCVGLFLLGLAASASAQPATPADPVDVYEANAIVTGTLDWNEALPGWVGAWRAPWHGVDHRWGVSGVNYDAAFRNIVAGVVSLAAGRGPLQ